MDGYNPNNLNGFSNRNDPTRSDQMDSTARQPRQGSSAQNRPIDPIEETPHMHPPSYQPWDMSTSALDAMERRITQTNNRLLELRAQRQRSYVLFAYLRIEDAMANGVILDPSEIAPSQFMRTVFVSTQHR
jgi:hypothetical protein